jgi:hypothetical protein
VVTGRVLDERVSPDNDARRSMRLQSLHWTEPCLQATVGALDPVALPTQRDATQGELATTEGDVGDGQVLNEVNERAPRSSNPSNDLTKGSWTDRR